MKNSKKSQIITHEVVQQHLKDKNHVITDDDIKNSVTDIDALSKSKKKKLIDEKTKELPSTKDKKHITPFDLLSD